MEQCEDCSNVQDSGFGYCGKCGGGLLVSITETELQQSLEKKEALQALEEAQTKLEEAEARARAEIMSSIEIITLQAHPSRKILSTIGIVKGVSDLQAGIISLKSQKTIYESGFETAKRELAVAAHTVGANAVLGVLPLVNSNNPGSSTLAGGGMKSTETVILCGTAVILE